MADTNQILRLAAIIREVDGNHSKGAAALAESILDHPDFRAALAKADGPAVPEGREPAAVTEQPSDQEIMGLMPQQMHEDLAYAARAMANEAGTDNRKAKGFMRIALNRHAVDLARAVLARWGNPAPVPPADGEVAKLAAWLRETGDTIQPSHLAEHQRYKRAAELLQRQAPQPPADGEVVEVVEWLHTVVAAYKSCRNTDHIWSLSGNGVNARLTVTLLTRAAELLQRQVLVPVSVSERLPEPSVKVLAHYFNGLGKERTICAIWVPAKTRSDSYGDDDFTEYDEESDTFYWPEGWYETIENWDDLGYVKVDEGEVIYWQPIPKLSAHALPLPEVGE